MLEIIVTNKFLDLSKSIKLFYVIALGIFTCTLSFLFYRDFIIKTTFAIITVAIYFLMSLPPKKLTLKLDDTGINYGGMDLKWEKCLGFSMVNLEEMIEFIIQTNEFGQNFYYFYIDADQTNLKEFIVILSQCLPYDETISKQNIIHNVLRNFGLN